MFSKAWSGTSSIRIIYKVVGNVNYLAPYQTYKIRKPEGGTRNLWFNEPTRSFWCLQQLQSHFFYVSLHNLLVPLPLVPTSACGHLLCHRCPQVQPDSAFPRACVLHLLPPVPGLTFGFQRYRGWDLAQCPGMCTVKVYRQFPLPWGHIFKKWEIGTGEYIFLTLSQWMDYFDIKFAWFLGEQFCEIKQ